MLKRGPAEAVLELNAIVLLMMFTWVESSSEIPAPSQPATLSAMMLLVTVTVSSVTSVGSIPHNEVGIDHQAWTGAVAWPNSAKRGSGRIASRCAERHAILVDRGIAVANYICVGGTHDDDTTAVGWDRRVGALIEHNRVVFDVTSVAEPKLTDAAAVARAQVSANPVVVEFVEV